MHHRLKVVDKTPPFIGSFYFFKMMILISYHCSPVYVGHVLQQSLCMVDGWVAARVRARPFTIQILPAQRTAVTAIKVNCLPGN